MACYLPPRAMAKRHVERIAVQRNAITKTGPRPHGRLRLRAVLTVAFGAVAALPVRAEVSTDDLQAIARTLGFLETLPNDGTLAVGIVYAPGRPDGASIAAETADKLNAIPGPNSATFKAASMPVDGLAADQDRLDVLILAPGTCSDATTAAPILEAVRRRRVVSIASDPACLDAQCCVLMVRAGHKVEIVLDKSLADSAGLRFASVFSMMVKRK